MKFTLLLFALGKILERASKKNTAFRNYIGSIHSLKIMIRTADGRYGRLFIFDQGKVQTKAGAHHPCDAAIIWSDAATGFAVMTSKDSAAQFTAAAEGKMKLDGNAFFAQWFNDGVKLVM